MNAAGSRLRPIGEGLMSTVTPEARREMPLSTCGGVLPKLMQLRDTVPMRHTNCIEAVMKLRTALIAFTLQAAVTNSIGTSRLLIS